MKYLIYILISLLMALFVYNLINFREGLESCPAGETNAAAQRQTQCSTVNSKVNEDLMAKVKKSFADLKKVFEKTSKQINWNSTHAKINYTNAQKLQNVADGKDNDNTDACKKYPEAC